MILISLESILDLNRKEINYEHSNNVTERLAGKNNFR